MEVDEIIHQKLNDNPEHMNELQFFRLLFSDEILNLLVEESNNYYRNVLIAQFGEDFKKVILSKESTGSYPYLYVTKGINREDILAYLGIRIYMGIHKLPSTHQYWKRGLHQTNINKIMSSTYFFLLGTALHFPEKEKKDDDTSSIDDIRVDPRHKINLYLEKLALNFQRFYDLGSNITIDESLLQFKGRNSMKFYIPMKPHKYGFKIHLLCDSDTHYLYNMLFDPGRGGKEHII